jgi:hypothetical protein
MPPKTTKRTAASMSFPKSKRRCRSASGRRRSANPLIGKRDRDLLRRFRNGKFSSWFERLRRIQRLSRLPLKQSREYLELGYYDDPPLPSLLVAFKEHDAITACFDEEGQYMMEGTPSRPCALSFRRASRSRFGTRCGLWIASLRLNCELFQLVEEIQGRNACRYIYRSGRTIASSCMRRC